jgi:hypothetical protein
MRILKKAEFKKATKNKYNFSCDNCMKKSDVMVVFGDEGKGKYISDYEETIICESCLVEALEGIRK